MTAPDSGPATTRPRLRRAGNAALTMAAVGGLLSLLAALAFTALGVTPLVVTSGSMSPTIPTGSLALARTVDATDLAVGDVVSVLDDGGDRITHRVLDVSTSDGAGLLTLKGDANDHADAAVHAVTSADRVLGSVPHAGRLLSAVASPTGRGIALGAGTAVALALLWPRAGGTRRRGERVATLAVLGLVVGIGVGLARTPDTTSAAWSDRVEASSTITVALPFVGSCSTTGRSVTLSWPPIAGAVEYEVELKAWWKAQSTASTTLVGTSAVVSTTPGADTLVLPNGADSYRAFLTARDAHGNVVSSTWRWIHTRGNRVQCGFWY